MPSAAESESFLTNVTRSHEETLHGDSLAYSFDHTELNRDTTNIDNLKEQFKLRYDSLKQIYEDRLGSLANGIQVAVNELQNDHLLNLMNQDPAMFHHAQARMAELLSNSLNMEREQIIAGLAADVTVKQGDIVALTEECEEIQEKLQSTLKSSRKKMKRMQHELEVEKDGKKKATSMIEELQRNLNSQKNDFERKFRDFDEEKRKLKEIIQDLKFKLQTASVAKQNTYPDIQASLTKAEILEERIRSQNILFSEKENQRASQLKFLENELLAERERTSAVEKERVQLESRLSVIVDENANLQAELSEKRFDEEGDCRRHIQHLEAQLQSVKELLAKSESDRLELREKYLQVGNKVENLLISEALESDEIIQGIKSKLGHQKHKYQIAVKRLKDMLEVTNEKLNDCEKALSKRESDFVTLQNQSKVVEERNRSLSDQVSHLREELNAVVAVRSEHVIELEAARRSIGSLSAAAEKLKDREEELHRIRMQFESRIAELAREARVAVDAEVRAKEATVAEYESQLKASNEQITTLQNRLVELDMSKLRESVNLTNKTEVMKQESADKITSEYLNQVKEMKSTHISRELHEQICHGKVTEEAAKYAEKISQLTKQYEVETYNKLRELEDQKQKDYALAMLNIRKGIKKLEEQLSQERSQRVAAESCVDEERKTMIGQLKKVEELEESKLALSAHLEKANVLITKLKLMIKDANSAHASALSEVQKLKLALQEVETTHANEITELKATKDSLTKDVEQNLLERNRERMEHQAERLMAVQNEVRELVLEKKSIAGTADALKAEMLLLSNSMAVTKSQCESLATRLQEKENQLRELEKVCADKNRKVEELMLNHASQLESLKNEERSRELSLRGAHESAIIRIQSTLDTNHEILSKAKDSENTLARKLEKIKADLVAAQEKCVSYQETVSKLNNINEGLKQEITSLNREHAMSIESREGAITAMKSRIHSLEITSQEYLQSIETLKSQWKTLSKHKTNIITTLQKRVLQLREAHLALKSVTNLTLMGMKGEMMSTAQRVLWKENDALNAIQREAEAHDHFVRNQHVAQTQAEVASVTQKLIATHKEQLSLLQSNLEHQVEKLTDELNTTKEILSKLRHSSAEEINGLKSNLLSLTHKSESAERLVVQLEAEKNKIEASLLEISQTRSSESSTFTTKIKEFEEQVKHLDLRLHNASSIIAVLSSALNISQQVDFELAVDTSDQARFNAAFKKLQEALKQSIVDTKENTEEPLRVEICKLQEALTSKEREKTELHTQAVQIENEMKVINDRLAEENNNLQTQLQHLTARLTELMHENQEAKEEFETFQAVSEEDKNGEVARLENLLSDAKNKLEREQSRFLQEKQQWTYDAALEKEEWRKGMEKSFKDRENDMMVRISKEQDKVKELRNELYDTAKEADRMLKEEQESHTELEAIRTKLQHEVDEKTKLLDMKDDEINNLRIKMEAYFVSRRDTFENVVSGTLSKAVNTVGDMNQGRAETDTATMDSTLLLTRDVTVMEKESTLVDDVSYNPAVNGGQENINHGNTSSKLPAPPSIPQLGINFSTMSSMLLPEWGESRRLDLSESTRLENEASEISDRLRRRLQMSAISSGTVTNNSDSGRLSIGDLVK